MMLLILPNSSGRTSEALFRSMMLQNSICSMMSFSRSSSSKLPSGRASPQLNSLCILRASTTVTMQSSFTSGPSVRSESSGREQMVWAIGAGSHIPLASITM